MRGLEIRLKACFKRRASHVPNALETIDNEAFQLIIYCFKCVRHMRSATFELGLRLRMSIIQRL
jgi:hypothetical protein